MAQIINLKGKMISIINPENNEAIGALFLNQNWCLRIDDVEDVLGVSGLAEVTQEE